MAQSMTQSAAQPAADPLEWPASPWACSAPESYLLLHFRKHDPKQALKLGLLELIARQRLRLVDVARKKAFGRRQKVAALVHPDGSSAGADPLSPSLDPLLDVHRSVPAKPLEVWEETAERGPQPAAQVNGVEVSRFATAAVQRFGSMDGYIAKIVRPTLVDRGWVARASYRKLGFIPSKRWELTHAGTAAQGDLLWRVEYGNRQLGRLVDDDPTRAVAFVGLAGAAILLMDDARPHLQRLRQRIDEGARAAAADGDDDFGDYSSSGDAAAPSGLDTSGAALGDVNASMVDFGALDSALSGLDLSALDGIDAAFDAVDAGVDAGSGGSDGGSDGGGDSGGSSD